MKLKSFISYYNLYLLLLVVLNLLPFLAPLLLKLSEQFPVLEYPAKFIYLCYSFTCHQFHHRSLHIYDHQCAWCTRDMGIWLGILSVAVLVRSSGVKGIKWYWVVPFAIPMALDGGIQTIATVLGVSLTGPTGEVLYVSNNLTRFITGSIFGVGLSLWISPVMWGIVASHVEAEAKRRMLTFKSIIKTIKQSPLALSTSVIGVMLIIYLGLIQLWSATSIIYRPTDFADSAVRTPATDFFVRRRNGICPSKSEEPFTWECFFKD